MPIREYVACDDGRGCPHCRAGFEHLEKLEDPPLKYCPKCGGPIKRQLSAPRIGSSQSSLDDRAKSAGFTKLKRLGKGEYEREY
jgi:putative FmdB family regulatory protein